ncbi:MAG: hypothetical protein OXQ93_13915 [Gemmatimonadota bacterium]|nr:hypothetical protein [Gemmatimonadota bacterium]
MADQRLSALTRLLTAADGDYLYIVDVSEAMTDRSKRILISDLISQRSLYAAVKAIIVGGTDNDTARTITLPTGSGGTFTPSQQNLYAAVKAIIVGGTDDDTARTITLPTGSGGTFTPSQQNLYAAVKAIIVGGTDDDTASTITLPAGSPRVVVVNPVVHTTDYTGQGITAGTVFATHGYAQAALKALAPANPTVAITRHQYTAGRNQWVAVTAWVWDTQAWFAVVSIPNKATQYQQKVASGTKFYETALSPGGGSAVEFERLDRPDQPLLPRVDQHTHTSAGIDTWYIDGGMRYSAPAAEGDVLLVQLSVPALVDQYYEAPVLRVRDQDGQDLADDVPLRSGTLSYYAIPITRTAASGRLRLQVVQRVTTLPANPLQTLVLLAAGVWRQSTPDTATAAAAAEAWLSDRIDDLSHVVGGRVILPWAPQRYEAGDYIGVGHALYQVTQDFQPADPLPAIATVSQVTLLTHPAAPAVAGWALQINADDPDPDPVPAALLSLSPGWTWTSNPTDPADRQDRALYLRTRGGDSPYLRGATPARAGLLTAAEHVKLAGLPDTVPALPRGPRGHWTAGQAYRVGDILRRLVPGGVREIAAWCRRDHTSDLANVIPADGSDSDEWAVIMVREQSDWTAAPTDITAVAHQPSFHRPVSLGTFGLGGQAAPDGRWRAYQGWHYGAIPEGALWTARTRSSLSDTSEQPVLFAWQVWPGARLGRHAIDSTTDSTGWPAIVTDLAVHTGVRQEHPLILARDSAGTDVVAWWSTTAATGRPPPYIQILYLP